MTSARPTLRCVHCKLVQYPTVKGDCRKCHKNPYELVTKVVLPADGVNAGDAGSTMVSSVSHWARTISSQAFSENIGNSLKLLRLAADLSQRDLATIMACPRTYISKIENAQACPTVKSFRRFATAFGVSPWFLAEAVEYLSAQHSLEEIPDDK